MHSLKLWKYRQQTMHCSGKKKVSLKYKEIKGKIVSFLISGIRSRAQCACTGTTITRHGDPGEYPDFNVYFHVLFACLSEFSHFLSSCLGIITLAFLREKTTILYLFAIIYLLIFTIIYLLSTIIIKYYYLLISFLEINLKYAKQN